MIFNYAKPCYVRKEYKIFLLAYKGEIKYICFDLRLTFVQVPLTLFIRYNEKPWAFRTTYYGYKLLFLGLSGRFYLNIFM
jgi:hypothetical protein